MEMFKKKEGGGKRGEKKGKVKEKRKERKIRLPPGDRILTGRERC